MFNVLKDLSLNINNYTKSTHQSLNELVYYVLIDLFIPTNWPSKLKSYYPYKFLMDLVTKPEAERFGNHAVDHVQIPEAE
ncbi:hypothetical protein DAPPUDRAFT_236750 [Daphnia pulex]|uniref:Uncharacterized protein n=1 Tax=Daphnia pulex TaxID=6669 RepID=E9G306_DAPPU|nr:hypothetical protein DAPPUDRAFT_236750 [Daphnia pulex]|eukprot:EFX86133.1 hypothetical protein DAPPUDRAFT_236750 [Daphnia pulex]